MPHIYVGHMTIHDACKAFRAAGIPVSTKSMADGIASGRYSFGRVVSVGPNGNRKFEIFPRDLYDWLAGKAAPNLDQSIDPEKSDEEEKGSEFQWIT